MNFTWNLALKYILNQSLRVKTQIQINWEEKVKLQILYVKKNVCNRVKQKCGCFFLRGRQTEQDVTGPEMSCAGLVRSY